MDGGGESDGKPPTVQAVLDADRAARERAWHWIERGVTPSRMSVSGSLADKVG